MSKKTIDLEKTIMAQVKSGQIAMKPRWYFILGSFLMGAGLASASIVAIFLSNLSLFLLRQHGPRSEWRLQLMLDSFPWWIPLLAVVGIVAGVYLLKKYDFSYKRNFSLLVAVFIVAIFAAALIIDQVGLNDTWSRQGPMRRFYYGLEEKDTSLQPRRGGGQGMRRNFSF